MPISVLGAIMAPELAEGLNLLSDVPLEVSNRPFGLDIFSMKRPRSWPTTTRDAGPLTTQTHMHGVR